MTGILSIMAGLGEGSEKKRKLPNENEIEIDVSAPEPPSKKALRKSKRKGFEATPQSASEQQKDESAQQGEATSKTRSDYGIWIGNLAFFVTKDDLRKFITSNCSFSDATITRIHMPKNPDKHGKAQNKGFAYVDFSTSRALKEAMGLNEQMVGGRRVLIKDAKSFEGRPEKSQDNGQMNSTSNGSPPSKRIFVGNLGFDVTKEALEEHFGPCGTVANIHMATFQDTGKCKGYAWVEFEDLAAAEAAVKGYVMVSEEDEEEEEDESDSEERKQSKPRKPRQKRVWVNQLLGRRMRTEFAEDPTTRYKKRFGEGKTQGNTEEAEDDSYGQVSTGTGTAAPARPPRKAKSEYSRYDQGTVQKLSGAIVESKGQKVTFN